MRARCVEQLEDRALVALARLAQRPGDRLPDGRLAIRDRAFTDRERGGRVAPALLVQCGRRLATPRRKLGIDERDRGMGMPQLVQVSLIVSCLSWGCERGP